MKPSSKAAPPDSEDARRRNSSSFWPAIAESSIRPRVLERELSPMQQQTHRYLDYEPHSHRSPARRNNNNYKDSSYTNHHQHSNNSSNQQQQQHHHHHHSLIHGSPSCGGMSMDLDSPFRRPPPSFSHCSNSSRVSNVSAATSQLATTTSSSKIMSTISGPLTFSTNWSQPPSPLGLRSSSLFYPSISSKQINHTEQSMDYDEHESNTSSIMLKNLSSEGGEDSQLPRTPEMQRIRNPRPCSVAKRTPGIVIDMESLEPVDYMATPVKAMRSSTMCGEIGGGGSNKGGSKNRSNSNASTLNGNNISVCRPSPFYKPELYHPSPERYMIIEDSDCTMSPNSGSPLPIGLQTPRRPQANNLAINGTPMSWRGPSARKLFGGGGGRETVLASSPLLNKHSPVPVFVSPCPETTTILLGHHTSSIESGGYFSEKPRNSSPLSQSLTEVLEPLSQQQQQRSQSEEILSQTERFPSPTPNNNNTLQNGKYKSEKEEEEYYSLMSRKSPKLELKEKIPTNSFKNNNSLLTPPLDLNQKKSTLIETPTKINLQNKFMNSCLKSKEENLLPSLSITPQRGETTTIIGSVHQMQTRSAKKQRKEIGSIKQTRQIFHNKPNHLGNLRGFSDVCNGKSVTFECQENNNNNTHTRQRRLLFGPIITKVTKSEEEEEETDYNFTSSSSSSVGCLNNLIFKSINNESSSTHYDLRRTPQRISRTQERYTTC